MFNSTYGAGYRAGMSERTFEIRHDGKKYPTVVTCPFRHPLQFISRELWYSGMHDGTMRRLRMGASKW